jgi:AraC-like DNA-binding protein
MPAATHYQDLPIAGDAPPRNKVALQHFDVSMQPVHLQLLAWRERMGQVIDVVPLLSEIERPFRGSIYRYDVGQFLFADCYTDRITLDRTIARISRDNARSIVFHVFLEAAPGSLLAYPAKRGDAALDGGILAVDLDQPVRLLRGGCHHVTIFMPGEELRDVFTDPGALHGRVLSPRMPSVSYLIGRVVSLAAHIRFMTADDAHRDLHEIVHLVADAYGEQAGLKGGQRALVRAIAFDHARHFVHENLADSDLSPERVVESLGLSRPTIYRLFQHEGGLGAYIRHLRLRAAANDLVRFPGIPVQDIGFSVGFKSASDFSRAFRRAYGIAPQEVRMHHEDVRVPGFNRT